MVQYRPSSGNIPGAPCGWHGQTRLSVWPRMNRANPGCTVKQVRRCHPSRVLPGIEPGPGTQSWKHVPSGSSLRLRASARVHFGCGRGPRRARHDRMDPATLRDLAARPEGGRTAQLCQAAGTAGRNERLGPTKPCASGGSPPFPSAAPLAHGKRGLRRAEPAGTTCCGGEEMGDGPVPCRLADRLFLPVCDS
jgi:hypothetical protein